MHRHQCMHMVLVKDMDMRIHRCMHIALCGSGFLLLKPKRYRKAPESLLVGRKRSRGGQEG